jgi:hypothetical protein
MLAQKQISRLIFTDVAAAEAATPKVNETCFVKALDTLFSYEPSGAAYTRDGMYVLNTAAGGTTRWLGVAGKYVVLGAFSYVEASAGLVATPRVLVSGDCGKTITNEGIGAENYNELGSVGTPLSIGWWAEFVVQDANGMNLSCPAGETINMGPISGTILESFDVGAMIVVKKINATQWIVTSQSIGAWSIS